MKDNVLFKIKDFELLASNSCNLYLEINEQNYNYAVVDAATNNLTLIGSSNSSISDTNNPILDLQFDKIRISLLTKNFTFIPEVHYTSSLETAFSSFLQADYTEVIKSDFLKYQEIRKFYTLKKSLVNELENKFSAAELSSQVKPFFKACLNTSKNNSNPKLYLNFKEGHIELLVLTKEDLLFYNIFEFKNDDELQYFIILCMQQLNLKAEEITVKISGDMNFDSSTWLIIQGIFKEIEYNFPGFLTIGEEFNDAPMHQFVSLLGLHLCE